MRASEEGLKHGPGGRGGPGPCDPHCRKCEREAAPSASLPTWVSSTAQRTIVVAGPGVTMTMTAGLARNASAEFVIGMAIHAAERIGDGGGTLAALTETFRALILEWAGVQTPRTFRIDTHVGPMAKRLSLEQAMNQATADAHDLNREIVEDGGIAEEVRVVEEPYPEALDGDPLPGWSVYVGDQLRSRIHEEKLCPACGQDVPHG